MAFRLPGDGAMRNVGLRTTTPSAPDPVYRSEAPAIRSLERQGFTEPFTADCDTLRLAGRDRRFRPEELRIRDHFRFEGTSDPDDMSVIYALEASDGTRGYLVDAFGAYADPRVTALVERIPMERWTRPHGTGTRASVTVSSLATLIAIAGVALATRSVLRWLRDRAS